MCCCHQHHGRHAHGACGSGSRRQPCGEKGHSETHLHQVLQDLQTRVRAVEEQLGAEKADE